MTEYYINASIAVKWAVEGDPFRSKTLALLRDAGTRGIRLIAPPIFSMEADGAIQKCVFDGRITTNDALRAYAILDAAPVELVHLSDGLPTGTRDLGLRGVSSGDRTFGTAHFLS